MSKIDKNKKKIIAIISGIILIAIIVFLLWFFNRKFDVTFDLNNGTKDEIIKVKYHQTINKKDIKDQEDLGELFIAWYEVVGVKEKEDVLADKPFDFNTKIDKDIKLKALYKGKVETITITFDSKGGSTVDSITINKGTELILPKDPTYAGYTFKGWYDINETPIHNNVLLEEDTTLYAKWEKIPEPKPEPTPVDEFKVGDKVCVKGYATEASDGTGKRTANYGGNPKDPTDIRYITLICKGAKRPYHISVGKEIHNGDRGWVTKEQLTKVE